MVALFSEVIKARRAEKESGAATAEKTDILQVWMALGAYAGVLLCAPRRIPPPQMRRWRMGEVETFFLSVCVFSTRLLTAQLPRVESVRCRAWKCIAYYMVAHSHKV